MQSETSYRCKNFVATPGVCGAMMVIGYLAAKGILRSYLFELLLLVAVFLTWLVNRFIPFWQIFLLFTAIVAVSFIFENATEFFLPISILSDKVIYFVLISGFGIYWVHRGYILDLRNIK